MNRIHRLLLAAATAAILSPGHAYNETTHQDITSYAYELMSVADDARIRAAVAGEPDLVRFLDLMPLALKRLDRLPSALAKPHLPFCLDDRAAAKLGSPMPFPQQPQELAVSEISVPVYYKYTLDKMSCGADMDWLPGTLYKQRHPDARSHAGNVLGYWAASPDLRIDDTKLNAVRITNIGGIAVAKEVLERAGGVAVGTVWVTAKCALRCVSAIFKADFDACGACVQEAIDQAKTVAHDGVATLDGLIPGFGEIKSADLVGVTHHIDAKTTLPAPGWNPLSPQRYDDLGGLYVATAGPNGVPGVLEMTAITAAVVPGTSVDYDDSPSTRLYQVTDGQDFHQNSRPRSKQDWEFRNWTLTPFTPLDNLAWYGWSHFRDSAAAHQQAPNSIETQYLGWALHGLGDATVPMHVTSTFGYGHRPYEDAVARIGREMLGGAAEDASGRELQQAIQILRRALGFRQQILAWRAAHPERGLDIPIRDLVTTLANDTLAQAAGQPLVYNDILSVVYMNPLTESEAVEAYKVNRVFMRDRAQLSVAATVAFLASASEALP